MNFPLPEELQVLVLLANEFLERGERLHIGHPAILEAAAIVIRVLIHIVGVANVRLAERVTECEVGRVPRHRVLALHIKFQARDTEVLHRVARHCIGIDRIFLCIGFASVDSIFQQHILIKRIILGSGLLIAVRVIDGSMEFHLLGQEAAHVGLHCHIILVVVVESTMTQALINRAKARSFLVHAHIHSGNVAHAQAQTCLGSPAAILVKVGHTQFIDPNGTVLSRVRVVAHTNHHHAHLAQ